LIAYPVSHPKQAPIPNTTKKSTKGVNGPAPMLLSSLIAKIVNINIELAINSEKNCPVFVMKGAGYVQNMPAVAFGE
jgi:hypothetical protein